MGFVKGDLVKVRWEYEDTHLPLKGRIFEVQEVQRDGPPHMRIMYVTEKDGSHSTWIATAKCELA